MSAEGRGCAFSLHHCRARGPLQVKAHVALSTHDTSTAGGGGLHARAAVLVRTVHVPWGRLESLNLRLIFTWSSSSWSYLPKRHLRLTQTETRDGTPRPCCGPGLIDRDTGRRSVRRRCVAIAMRIRARGSPADTMQTCRRRPLRCPALGAVYTCTQVATESTRSSRLAGKKSLHRGPGYTSTGWFPRGAVACG